MKQLRTVRDIATLGTILSVWAHPDDESYLAAGILATAVQNGQKVVCITATKGEVGSQDEARWPAATLGSVRAQEMAAALKILGITRHHWLDYPDGSCSDIPLSQATPRLAALITREMPDTIITFGPDGWTGHPDHCIVSCWVDKALQDLQLDIARYHAVLTPEHYEHCYKKVDAQFNFFFNIDRPPLLQAEQCDIYFELPESIRLQKYQALAAMRSQTELVFKRCDPALLTQAFAIEAFVRADTTFLVGDGR